MLKAEPKLRFKMHSTSLDYTNRQNAVDLELLKLWRFYLKISEYVCTVCAKAKIEQVYKFEAKNREFVMFLWRILKQFTLQFHLRIGKIQAQDKNLIRLKIISCFQPFFGTQIYVFQERLGYNLLQNSTNLINYLIWFSELF